MSLPRSLLLLLFLSIGAFAGFLALTRSETPEKDVRERENTAASGPTGGDVEQTPTREDTAGPPTSPARGRDPSPRDPHRIVQFHGRVVDAFDAPLVGCRVVCEPAPDVVTVEPVQTVGHAAASHTTGANGRFELSMAADSDDLVFSFVHPDFEPRVGALRRLGPAGVGPTDLGVFVLTSGQGLAAAVREAETGTPIPRAHVRLRPEVVDPTLPPVTLRLFERSATTDANGRVVFGGLPAGAYLLRFESDDHVAHEARVRHPTSAETTSVELERSHVLRGRLISADGDAIPGAILRAHPRHQPAPPAVEGISGDAGDFRIPRLRGGAYCLTVDTREHGTHEIPDLVIPAGFPFTVRMPARSEVAGTVYRDRPSGRRRPAGAGVRIELRAETASALRRQAVWATETRADGTFSIEAVPQGRYRVRATTERGRGSLATFRGSLNVPSPPVSWTLRSTIRLRGRIVLDEDPPRPAMFASIRTVPASVGPASEPDPVSRSRFETFGESATGRQALERSPTTSSDDFGTFVLADLDRIPVRLRVELGTGAAWFSHVLDLRAPPPGTREYDVGEIRMPSPDRVSIRGTVSRADGSPVAGAAVTLESSSAAEENDGPRKSVRSGRTDPFGRFRLESIPNGRYLLRARSADAGDDTAQRTLELPRDAASTIRLELPRTP